MHLQNEGPALELAQLWPALLFTADATGSIDFASERWSELTGSSIAQLMDHGWRTIIHPDDFARAEQAWRRAVETGEPLTAECRMRAAGGGHHWVLVRAVPARDATGRVVRWYGSGFDVDDLRRATQTLQFFADVGESLTVSLGVQATLEVLMQSVVPEYADWGFVNLIDDEGDLRVAAVYHADAQKRVSLESEVGQRYASGRVEAGAVRAVRTREPVLYKTASYADAASVVEPDVLETFWNVGFTSVLVVPLLVGSSVRGTLNVAMYESRRSFSASDVPFFQELARRVAPAIANAEVYERERKVAQSFQEAALPRELPRVPGFRFSAIYEAGRTEALIGGDWYDAFALVDGRIVISIGDVAGSGLQAAVTMASVRQALRGVAQVHADPGLMLEAADRALRAEIPDRFVTAFVGVIDPVAGTLGYACAGHPPPIVRTPDGATSELECSGPPLGLREQVRGGGRVVPLPSNSLLVLYTDGLIESTHDVDEGLQRLHAAVADPSIAAAESAASEIYQAVLLGGSRDDVAILTVGTGDPPGLERWTFDARDSAAAHRVVAAIRERLLLASYREQRLATAELLIAELIGNTVRYAPGPIEVLLDAGGKHPVVHVLDRGPGFEFAARLPLDPYSESGRGLFLIASLAEDMHVVRRPGGGSHARVVLPLAR